MGFATHTGNHCIEVGSEFIFRDYYLISTIFRNFMGKAITLKSSKLLLALDKLAWQLFSDKAIQDKLVTMYHFSHLLYHKT